MTPKAVSILIVLAQVLGAGFSQAEPDKVIGSWRVEIIFENGTNRSLRFEAQDSGKGSFLRLDPGSKVWGPAQPSEAKWTQGEEGSVMFSGTVEFPLGNVGRETGTLVLTGKFETDVTITGTAKFLPARDPNDPEAKPSRNGRFKATRDAGG